MGDEYDVESKITVDDKPARAALLRIAQDFDELHAHAVKTGQAIRAAMGGLRAETKAYANTVAIATGRMNLLATSTAKVAVATKPLSGALERANSQTARLAAEGKKAGDSLTGAFNRAGRAGSSLGGIVRSAIGFGAAYLGVQALVGGFKSLVSESFRFQSGLDKNRISLGAIIAATDSFKAMADPVQRMAQAGRVGDAVFRQLQGDALKSVATGQELATIYTGIAGPLFGAGAKLSEIRQITNDTVSAASVLGVDFAQAARDINLMATGVAGQDTALFRMLKSTKAITQSTEEWNKMLPQKRVEAMKKALAGFGPAGKEFEKSLPGITSSFVDFMQRFRGAFMGGPLEQLRKLMVRIVDIFSTHQTKILALLTTLGNGFARFLDPALNAFARVTEYFINNWEKIAGRIENTWLKLQSLAASAKHYAPALKAGSTVAGAGMLAGRLAPGAVGGGAAAISAGWAGGTVAGAGGLSTAISEISLFFSVIAAMGTAPVWGIVALALAAIVGLFGVLVDSWSLLTPVLSLFATLLQDLFGAVWGLAVAFATALWPAIKLVGAIVAILGGALLAVGFIIMRNVVPYVVYVFGLIGKLFGYLGSAFTWLYEHVVSIFNAILRYIGKEGGDLLTRGDQKHGFLDELRAQFAAAMSSFDKQKAEDESVLGGAEAGAPGTRKTTINDFRGSKIEVKQDFRNANPDNVWLQMLEGVNAGADQRLSSALVPDFTR